jgi:hypothetical protein
VALAIAFNPACTREAPALQASRREIEVFAIRCRKNGLFFRHAQAAPLAGRKDQRDFMVGQTSG